MSILYTLIFVHKPTQKTLKVHTNRYLNKYYYEKAKRELLTQLVKSRDISPDEIDILEHDHAAAMS